MAPPGTRLRCVLVCEIQDVEKAAPLAAQTWSSGTEKESIVLVDRPDLVLIQYILVYRDTVTRGGGVNNQKQWTRAPGARGWVGVGVAILGILWMVKLSSSSFSNYSSMPLW